MGYLTSITIVGAWPKGRLSFTERTDAEFQEEIAIVEEISNEASDCNNMTDDNDPMKAISLRHKGWIIEVECRGEDQEDLYRRRYLDGAYEQVAPVWPVYKTVVDDLEKAQRTAAEDKALVERVNGGLTRTLASWRVRLVDGRFFTCGDSDGEGTFDEVTEEVSREWVKANMERLCSTKQDKK